MNSFYITLLSDGSMDMFPNNTQSNFHIKLPKPIQLNKEEWEMALVELVIPSQIINISEEESQFQIVTTKPALGVQFKKGSNRCGKRHNVHTFYTCIKPGVYSTPEHLIGEINAVIQDNIGKVLNQSNLTFTFLYSKYMKRAKFNSNTKEIGLQFHQNLLTKLGGRSEFGVDGDVFPGDKNPFPYGVDLNVGSNHLFIYSNLADFTFLGNIEAPILRVIPFEYTTKDSNHVHKEFVNLHYVPLAKSSFDEIGINIRGDTGQLAQFVGGKSMIKLHFRKKSGLIL